MSKTNPISPAGARGAFPSHTGDHSQRAGPGLSTTMKKPVWKTTDGGVLVVAVCYVEDDLIGAITLIPGSGQFYGMPINGVISRPMASARAAMNYVETFIPRRVAA